MAVLETCFALTIFKDDVNAAFLVQFAALLILKAFHWLVQDRVEWVRSSMSAFSCRDINRVTGWHVDGADS